MPHRNAPLTETGRLRLARCIVEDGWSIRRAAERFQVSHTTAARWARRYQELGVAGMADRSSRPRCSPARTVQRTERRICKLRVTHRLGPARIAARLGLSPSTVHRVLVRYGMPPLTHLDRASGSPVRRYERDRPGELVHIDVKKLGNIPDGGGHRVLGRAAGRRNRQATTTAQRNAHGNPRLGHGFLHTALDDHSRLAYTEILTDETKETAAAFLLRAQTWFAARNIVIERVLTDNGSCYRSRLWAETCTCLGITHKRTRPYRPQTNGKVERFHRTLADEWAYARPYTSEAERRAALDPWLHMYNHHRGHTALKGQPPISRVTNLPGQYI
ncbi:IS481 family transposase [Sphaerisporangium melleum]|uniref:IS481 family transposase n=1 Tax=Sphaerisporangium melleum TaxID=321316 RepID=A0A917RLQ5_9ACTN|nr:IS481 family transposase [Sphaerisporangium melleum]GGL14563.1 IS481 family transposase [Sphaerisporangium melleum]GII69357.1 IS481 family transposase [Sphaerisporangium melleum]